MATITVNASPTLQAQRDTYLDVLVQKLNGLGKYQAQRIGSTVDLTPIFHEVQFFTVSPCATASDQTDFLRFLQSNPSARLVDLMTRNSSAHKVPTPSCLSKLRNDFMDDNKPLPAKVELVYNALNEIHARHLNPFFQNAVFPWFFSAFPSGRVFCVAMTEEADDYEFLLRQFTATVFSDFDDHHADPSRRKPFAEMLPSLSSHVLNVLRLCSQYNVPYIDAFSVEGSYSVFVFIPDESIHRRSLHSPNIFDCIAPFSSYSASPGLFEEDGNQDTVPKLHPKRGCQETDEWLRYWLRRMNALLDNLYDYSTAVSNGMIDMEAYVRRILHAERFLFEVTWSTAMLDQFLRKVLSYAVIDKVTSIMDNATWAPGARDNAVEAIKFARIFSQQFLEISLPSHFQNPLLQANAASWLAAIRSDMIAKTRDFAYPGNLISGGQIDVSGKYSRLNFLATAGATTVPEDVFMANLMRAVRNTHHGFEGLRDRQFSLLMAHSGVVSEQIASLLPLFAFAVLDDPVSALNGTW